MDLKREKGKGEGGGGGRGRKKRRGRRRKSGEEEEKAEEEEVTAAVLASETLSSVSWWSRTEAGVNTGFCCLRLSSDFFTTAYLQEACGENCHT